MIKFTQGEYPIYISPRHIIAVKADTGGKTMILTTGGETSDGSVYSCFKVDESVKEAVAALRGSGGE